MRPAEAIEHCYEPFREFDQLLLRIDAALRAGQFGVKGLVVCIEDPSFSWTSAFAPHAIDIRELWRTPLASCFRLQRSDAAEADSDGRMIQVQFPEQEVSLLLTLDSTHFYSNTLMPLVRSLSPWVATPFLTSAMLVDFLLQIKGAPGITDFVITDFASRSRIGHRKGTRKTRTERTWTEEPLEQVVELLAQSDRWLHSIAFKSRFRDSDGWRGSNGSISRACTFRCSKSAARLLDKLAGGLVERVARKHGLLKDRGRATRNDLSPRPILIEYAGGIFSDRSQNQRLIAVLAKLPKASLSVFHANPYFRASIVDFGDGSSYDLWVLSDTRLVISPQMRCTYASIERVSNHILSAFAEGEVKDLTEVIGVS